MKAKLTGYFDYDHAETLIEQINNVKSQGLHIIAFRADLSADSLNAKQMSIALKNQKIEVSLLNPMIETYDIKDINLHHEALDRYEKAFAFALDLGCQDVLYRLPTYQDFRVDSPKLEQALIDVLKRAKKYKRQVIIKQHAGASADLVFLLERLKKSDVGVVLDPSLYYALGEPVVKVYRLLRPYIKHIIANDSKKDLTPALLGFGETQVVKLLERLKKNQYNGYIHLDYRFALYLEKRVPKALLTRLFSKDKTKETKTAREVRKILFPKEEKKDIAYDDILDNQIKIINQLL